MVIPSTCSTHEGFPPQWCEWVARFVQGGSVGIKVNDDIGHHLKKLNDLR
jgi:hypothetical protein